MKSRITQANGFIFIGDRLGAISRHGMILDCAVTKSAIRLYSILGAPAGIVSVFSAQALDAYTTSPAGEGHRAFKEGTQKWGNAAADISKQIIKEAGKTTGLYEGTEAPYTEPEKAAPEMPVPKTVLLKYCLNYWTRAGEAPYRIIDTWTTLKGPAVVIDDTCDFNYLDPGAVYETAGIYIPLRTNVQFISPGPGPTLSNFFAVSYFSGPYYLTEADIIDDKNGFFGREGIWTYCQEGTILAGPGEFYETRPPEYFRGPMTMAGPLLVLLCV